MKNKKQLFEQVVAGNLPEKTLFRPILMHFAARYSGHTYGEFAADYHTLVACNLKALGDFDMDMVGLISDPYRETAAFGAPVKFIPEGVPICEKLIVHTKDDINNLKNPDVYKAERTLDRINGSKLYQETLKGEVPVIGWIEGPLAEACDLAGMSEIMMYLMLDPDFVNMLMDKVMITAMDFAKAQIDAGCDIIGIGDAVCSQVSQELYDDFVKARHQEIIQFIHAQGARVKLHICGNITHLLPSLKEVGMDILDLDWQVDLMKAREIVGEDVILCGNINPVDVQNKTETQIFDACKSLIQQQKDRKYILSAGCEITVNTPIENLMAMRKASLENGI